MIIKDNKKARNDNDIHKLQITRLSHLFLIYRSRTEQAITTTILNDILEDLSDFLLFDKIFCASKDFVIHSQLEMKEKLG